MTDSHDGRVHRREAVRTINDPLDAKFHESPPSRWPRRRGARRYEEGGRRRGEEDDEEEPAGVAAIRADRALTARRRQALLEVYDAFTARAGRRRRSER
jgi:hypothetical protein